MRQLSLSLEPLYHVEPNSVIVVWFSCGAASAVAAKKTIEKYGDLAHIRIVNNPIKEEDEDNYRFLKDVEKWLRADGKWNGHIEYAINSNFPNCSIKEVWDKRQYMSGVSGAPCTQQLKKKAREQWEMENHYDYIVLGFTADKRERKRFNNFKKFEKGNLLPILVEDDITKQDCYDIIKEAGVELPRMYRLGYDNANCPGCVKAQSPNYWNHVRKMHPEVFKDRAEQSRRIGAKLVKLHPRYIPESCYKDKNNF
jgi:hypothetical protein